MFQEALYPRAFFGLSPAVGRALGPGRRSPDLIPKEVTKSQSVHGILNWTFFSVRVGRVFGISQEIHKACLVYLINEMIKQT